MHPLKDLVPLGDALALLAAGARPVGRRADVPVAECVGRTLAVPVVAREDAPAGDRSRMDGYAVSTGDLGAAEGAVLPVQGRSLANDPGSHRLAPGACFEVATGALLPAGADAVVPVEDTGPGPEPGTVRFGPPPRPGAHVSARGSDYRTGETLIPAGAPLTSARAAAAAAAGASRLSVIDRPRVLVVPTGDEVVTTDGPLRPGQVRDSNSVGLASLVSRRGGVGQRHPVVGDDPEQLARALEEVRSFDAAVFTGGTSAGVKDHLAAVLERSGTLAFHGVAIRPGKPILFGQGGGVPVLGLPGNPTSCMLGAHLFLGPLVDRLSGREPAPARTARAALAADVSGFVGASPPPFTSFVLVGLDGGRATPVSKDSMTVTGAASADGYVAVAPGAPAPAAGSFVDVVLFE